MLANSFGNICKFPRRGMVGGPGGSLVSLLPTFFSLRYAQAIAAKNASISRGPMVVEVRKHREHVGLCGARNSERLVVNDTVGEHLTKEKRSQLEATPWRC
jgi:hypothetical protein